MYYNGLMMTEELNINNNFLSYRAFTILDLLDYKEVTINTHAPEIMLQYEHYEDAPSMSVFYTALKELFDKKMVTVDNEKILNHMYYFHVHNGTYGYIDDDSSLTITPTIKGCWFIHSAD